VQHPNLLQVRALETVGDSTFSCWSGRRDFPCWSCSAPAAS
jgi:hypothetical protein